MKCAGKNDFMLFGISMQCFNRLRMTTCIQNDADGYFSIYTNDRLVGKIIVLMDFEIIRL